MNKIIILLFIILACIPFEPFLESYTFSAGLGSAVWANSKNIITTADKKSHIIKELTLTSDNTKSLIKIDIDGNSRYTSFQLENPHRLVIDFEESKVGLQLPQIPKSDLFIKNISVMNFASKSISRIELTLKKRPSYTLKRTEHGVSIELKLLEEEALRRKLERNKTEELKKEIALLRKKNTDLNKQVTDLNRTLISNAKVDHPENNNSDIKQISLEEIYLKWIDAWEKKDIEAFIALYSDNFKARDMGIKEWKKYKKKTFDKYEAIILKTENVKIKLRSKNRGKIEFVQTFWADSYTDIGIKKIYLKHEALGWKIVKETWNPISK